MELESAQEAFVSLLGRIKNDSCKLQFLDWVCKEYSPIVPGNGVIEEEEDEPDVLDRIAADLRTVVPPTALAPGEQQNFTLARQKEGMNASNTLHVDSFLYPGEDEVDEMVKRLEIGRYYCTNCGSWKTLPLNFISHSVSKEAVEFIFKTLVPDLSNKMVVNIGSRLGPALYGGYLHSSASKLVSIECSKYFCDLQQQIINKYSMLDRIQVVCSDVRQQEVLLQSADLILISNVFEFFNSLEEQTDIWEFLYRTIRKRGSLIVTVPSIQESCNSLTFKNRLCLEEWVTEVDTGVDSQQEDLSAIHLYCVL